MTNCTDTSDKMFLLLLKETFDSGSNRTSWNTYLSGNDDDCLGGNLSGKGDPGGLLPGLGDGDPHDWWIQEIGKDVYGYVTPVIVVVGLLDNAVSLSVFTSKFMLRLSSTCYLATLSACHILILLTYVLMGWLEKGLPRWPGNSHVPLINVPVGCHLFLYVSYTLRFASVWLIVAFTVERYIAIVHPQYRRAVCARSFAKKVTVAVLLCSGVVCSYKPLLSGVYQMPTSDYSVCSRNPDYGHLSFMLDALFVVMITALPSIVISALSVPIFRTLRAKIAKGGGGPASCEPRMVFRENRIRLEFSVILLAISWCFILLTLPYFVTWCQHFWRSMSIQDPSMDVDRFSGHVAITRTIFYLNYAVNFFLYYLTGAHYRRQIRSILMLGYRAHRDKILQTIHGTGGGGGGK